MKNLFLALITSPSGKTSRKSFIILVTFLLIVFMAIFIAVQEFCYGKISGGATENIFNSLLFFLTGMITGAIVDKKVVNKVDTSIPEETET